MPERRSPDVANTGRNAMDARPRDRPPNTREPPHEPARSALGPAAWWGCAAVGLTTATLLLALQLYLQNVHISTANGLWKSIDVRHWMVDPGWHRIDFANVLYFPVQSLSCRLLDTIGVFPGHVWRQIAVLNAIAGGVAAASVYLFTLAWLRSHAVAVLAALLYEGSGFALLLSVISEDIMPGAVLVLIATLLACAWFARPTAGRIAIVAMLFCLGWLWEWRLIFPTLPPMLLVLFVVHGTWFQRLARPVWFVVAMSSVPALLAIAFRISGAGGAKPAWAFFRSLFWAGKGIDSSWGGFGAPKALLGLGGLAESFIGAQNLTSLDFVRDPQAAFEITAGLAILGILLFLAARYALRHRRDANVVAATVILGGTLAAGTVFNFYAQPQDPQMVINVMLWTIPAWGLAARAMLARPVARLRWGGWWPGPLRVLALACAVATIGYNVAALAAQRGLDAIHEALVIRLAARFDPARTVFLDQGFEPMVPWQLANWGGDFVDTPDLPPSASGVATFKFIAVTQIIVNNPAWNAEAMATYLSRQIDIALDRGYQVVASPSFAMSESEWAGSVMTLNHPDAARALYAVIHARYRLTPALHDARTGDYALVTRRPSP